MFEITVLHSSSTEIRKYQQLLTFSNVGVWLEKVD